MDPRRRLLSQALGSAVLLGPAQARPAPAPPPDIRKWKGLAEKTRLDG